tara:strand:- start:325 stop:1539 length:1215 start_codon:yes stop_codon:yes gene_type:complete
MSFKKFGPNDVINNTMRAYPSCEFLIFNGKVYYNNQPELTGAFSPQVLNIEPGHISLYEYNIDKLTGSNNFIYPFITKQGSGASFKTVGATTYTNEFQYGDTISSSYPMSASIYREYITTPSSSATGEFNRHFVALKNRLNYYGIRSQHYRVSSSIGFDKNSQILNLVSIPSIFYGTRIKPGSVSLKWYFTGSLIGELQDLKQNGELIQVGPEGSTNSGSVAGVIMYEEGFVLLTGSWDLSDETIPMTAGSTTTSKPSWLYWGAGMHDGVTQASTTNSGNTSDYMSASFLFNFKGQTDTQVLTMFAHARRGKIDHSNNPTFIKHGQTKVNFTSSTRYEENSSLDLVNIASSSYSDLSASYNRQVYISRVAIYDENKNLIGIATLSNPILKKEDQEYTFKLRLDI